MLLPSGSWTCQRTLVSNASGDDVVVSLSKLATRQMNAYRLRTSRGACKCCKALLSLGPPACCSPPQPPGHWSTASHASSAAGAASWPSWHVPWPALPAPLPTVLQLPSQHLHDQPACMLLCVFAYSGARSIFASMQCLLAGMQTPVEAG